MNWQTLIEQCEGVNASDAIVVAKILEYFPPRNNKEGLTSNSQENSDSEQSIYTCLFTTLLSLHAHQQQGNTCLPLSKIAGSHVFKTKVDANARENSEQSSKPGLALPPQVNLARIVSQWLASFEEQPPYTLHDGRLFIQRYFEYENEIFERVLALNKPIAINISETAKELFKRLFTSSQTLDWQAVAVANALQRQFMVLNGGPGTGKTHTVARFLIMMQSIAPNAKVSLVAPTGKAAQRLSESLIAAVAKLTNDPSIAQYAKHIETQAGTIHKTLGTRIGSTQARHNAQRFLPCDILVIDEFSMVDTAMFAKVLRACKPNTRILLVGDSAQLPSVEAGNLLGDLSNAASDGKSALSQAFIASLTTSPLESRPANVSDHLVTLVSNYRSNDVVTALATAIQQQQNDVVRSTLGHTQIVDNTISESDYIAIQKEKLRPLLDAYLGVLESATSPTELINALKTFKILSPIRKGPNGVEQLNAYICEYVLAMTKRESKQGIFHGQAIIITENDASTGLSNGDVGVLWDHSRGGQQIGELQGANQQNNTQTKLVAFIERDNTAPLELSTNRLPHYETAFALTIHKTQGSEYNRVFIVLPFQSTQTCSRELLYTGVTRAKEDVQILARESMLQECLHRSNRRDTYLGELLRKTNFFAGG
jgi:exodeoxyribonuclease V alpha subunit